MIAAGEGSPPITRAVWAEGRAIRVEAVTYREKKVSEVSTSFLWGLAFYLALCLTLLRAYRLPRRLVPAAIGALLLFLTHALYVFVTVRVNTVSNLGDISRARFSDGQRQAFALAFHFLRFSIDWIPIAIWLFPFVRSGSLTALRRGPTPGFPPRPS